MYLKIEGDFGAILWKETMGLCTENFSKIDPF